MRDERHATARRGRRPGADDTCSQGHVPTYSPGDLKTAGTTPRERAAGGLTAYAAARDRAIDIMARAEQSGPGPIRFAEVLLRILGARRPRLRYRLGNDAVWVPRARRLVLESLFEWPMRANYERDE